MLQSYSAIGNSCNPISNHLAIYLHVFNDCASLRCLILGNERSHGKSSFNASKVKSTLLELDGMRDAAVHQLSAGN